MSRMSIGQIFPKGLRASANFTGEAHVNVLVPPEFAT
jgi:hypothetical protein